MRSFGTVKPSFWNGPTGRSLRESGADAQLLALYLLTNPHANMIGLYYLPLVLVRKELAMSMAQIVKALAALERAVFATYDPESEIVWVFEMARYQLGDQLQPHDGRVKALARVYAEMSSNPFLGDFHDRYAAAFHLGCRREGGPRGTPRGGICSPLIPVPDPVPVLRNEESKDRFERFWRTYPKRKGKDAAWRAWQKRNPDEALTDEMIAALHQQMRDPDWIKDSGKYIPHPSTWLNQARWHDEPVALPQVSETTLRVVKGGLDYASGE